MLFFTENLEFFRFFRFFRFFGFFGLFRNSLFRFFRFYTETESFDVSIEPKPTEDQPKQFDIGSIFFAQICEFKTREKVSCRTYVLILL